MKKKACLAAALCLLSLSLIGAPTLADDIQRNGRIDAVTLAANELVISGTPYQLSWTAQVLGYRGEALSPNQLAVGHYVRFSANPPDAPNALPVVTELKLITQ